jgi:hypothetical protein
MNTINEVIAELLGSYKASFYITYFIFVMLGIIVSLRISSLKRDKQSSSTPYKFSFGFLIQDNIVRVLGSIAFVFLSIRCSVELFYTVPEYYTAVLMGLGFDQALMLAKKWQDLAREKLK